jgi:hypothetical protein
MTDRVRQILANTRHITVVGNGRCDECGFHIETQGHRDACAAH